MFALLNSRGVSAWHRETMARFSITAMAARQLGMGQGQRLRPSATCGRWSWRAPPREGRPHRAAPRELPPGRYTVILEPAAVLDLVGQMFGDFSATAIRDGRSFLNDRIGKKIFGENITIHDDVCAPAAVRRAFRWRGRAAAAADAGGAMA